MWPDSVPTWYSHGSHPPGGAVCHPITASCHNCHQRLTREASQSDSLARHGAPCMVDDKSADSSPASAGDGGVGPRAHIGMLMMYRCGGSHIALLNTRRLCIGDRLWSSSQLERSRAPRFFYAVLFSYSFLWMCTDEDERNTSEVQTCQITVSDASTPPFIHLKDILKIVEIPNLFFVSLDEEEAACTTGGKWRANHIHPRAIMRGGAEVPLARAVGSNSSANCNAPPLARLLKKVGGMDLKGTHTSRYGRVRVARQY